MTCCSHRSVRLLASVAFLALLALSTAGCKTSQSMQPTGTLGIASTPRSDADWRRSAETWGDRFRAKPGDPEAAINYAQALRGMGQRAQAAAVLEQASIQNPKHKRVRGAYGRALADTGNYQQALDVLNRAHAPDQPDWRILSVQGAMLDQMGRHDEARRYYATALRIAPDEPSVLSNLGLSYALSKDLVRAESTLRRATTHGRADTGVQQNLALVVGLQGRLAEAKTIARAELPSEGAAADVTHLRQMLAQQNGWEPQGESVSKPARAYGS
jgi:Flp pilus assembly protein TadD